MSEWLYQIRIKVTENISEDLRSKQKQSLSKKIKKRQKHNGHIRNTIYLDFLPRNDERTALSSKTKASR